MEHMNAPPDNNGRKVVYTERQGRLRYTYYDDGLVKITKYKRRSRVRWGRVIAALVFFFLCAYAIAHLIGFIAGAITGKKNEKKEKEFLFESSSAAAAQTTSAVEAAPPPVTTTTTTAPPPSDTSSAAAEPEVKKLEFKVCIDPGHGDYDIGVMNATGVTESSQNLEMGMLVKEKLEALGVSVVMTRTEDVNVSMDERCSIANESGCDLFVSLHMSGSSNPYDGSKGVTVLINNASPSMDMRLASNIMDALSSAGISQRNGVQLGFMGMPESNYQINTNTNMPSCQLELGYLTNDEDVALYAEKKELYASAIADALARTAQDLGVIGPDGKRLLTTGSLLSEGKSHIIVNEGTPIGSV